MKKNYLNPLTEVVEIKNTEMCLGSVGGDTDDAAKRRIVRGNDIFDSEESDFDEE